MNFSVSRFLAAFAIYCAIYMLILGGISYWGGIEVATAINREFIGTALFLLLPLLHDHRLGQVERFTTAWKWVASLSLLAIIGGLHILAMQSWYPGQSSNPPWYFYAIGLGAVLLGTHVSTRVARLVDPEFDKDDDSTPHSALSGMRALKNRNNQKSVEG